MLPLPAVVAAQEAASRADQPDGWSDILVILLAILAAVVAAFVWFMLSRARGKRPPQD